MRTTVRIGMHAPDALRLLGAFYGVVFLANGLAKLVPGLWNTPLGFLINADAARQILAGELARHPIGPYRDAMEALVLANWALAAPLLAGFEIVVGGALIAGLAVRWAALAGALFALHLHVLTLFNGRWLFEYALLWVPLLLLALIRPYVRAVRGDGASRAGPVIRP